MNRFAQWLSDHKVEDEDAAVALDLDRSTVSRIRRGLIQPSWETVKKITKFTDSEVTANDFVDLPNPDPPDPAPAAA